MSEQGILPPQEERQPGLGAAYRRTGKLRDKAAGIAGRDSGIGRAVAIAFAREGAGVAIVYLEHAEETRAVPHQRVFDILPGEGGHAATATGQRHDRRQFGDRPTFPVWHERAARNVPRTPVNRALV
jgi:NAD(P)-dependent dehydrogenase (short-subunit alcohol dehydrogenase family)